VRRPDADIEVLIASVQLDSWSPENQATTVEIIANSQ